MINPEFDNSDNGYSKRERFERLRKVAKGRMIQEICLTNLRADLKNAILTQNPNIKEYFDTYNRARQQVKQSQVTIKTYMRAVGYQVENYSVTVKE